MPSLFSPAAASRDTSSRVFGSPSLKATGVSFKAVPPPVSSPEDDHTDSSLPHIFTVPLVPVLLSAAEAPAAPAETIASVTATTGTTVTTIPMARVNLETLRRREHQQRCAMIDIEKGERAALLRMRLDGAPEVSNRAARRRKVFTEHVEVAASAVSPVEIDKPSDMTGAEKEKVPEERPASVPEETPAASELHPTELQQELLMREEVKFRGEADSTSVRIVEADAAVRVVELPIGASLHARTMSNASREREQWNARDIRSRSSTHSSRTRTATAIAPNSLEGLRIRVATSLGIRYYPGKGFPTATTSMSNLGASTSSVDIYRDDDEPSIDERLSRIQSALSVLTSLASASARANARAFAPSLDASPRAVSPPGTLPGLKKPLWHSASGTRAISAAILLASEGPLADRRLQISPHVRPSPSNAVVPVRPPSYAPNTPGSRGMPIRPPSYAPLSPGPSTDTLVETRTSAVEESFVQSRIQQAMVTLRDLVNKAAASTENIQAHELAVLSQPTVRLQPSDEVDDLVSPELAVMEHVGSVASLGRAGSTMSLAPAAAARVVSQSGSRLGLIPGPGETYSANPTPRLMRQDTMAVLSAVDEPLVLPDFDMGDLPIDADLPTQLTAVLKGIGQASFEMRKAMRKIALEIISSHDTARTLFEQLDMANERIRELERAPPPLPAPIIIREYTPEELAARRVETSRRWRRVRGAFKSFAILGRAGNERRRRRERLGDSAVETLDKFRAKKYARQADVLMKGVASTLEEAERQTQKEKKAHDHSAGGRKHHHHEKSSVKERLLQRRNSNSQMNLPPSGEGSTTSLVDRLKARRGSASSNA